MEPLNLERVIFLFSTAQQFEFEDVVDKLHLMMDKSVALVKVTITLDYEEESFESKLL